MMRIVGAQGFTDYKSSICNDDYKSGFCDFHEVIHRFSTGCFVTEIVLFLGQRALNFPDPKSTIITPKITHVVVISHLGFLTSRA